ncbi:hypothetical protein ACQEU6_06725 [Spirillospora sp. CA-108201]
MTDLHARLAAANPVDVAALGATAGTPDAQALLERILDEPAPRRAARRPLRPLRRRWKLVLPAAAALTAGATAFGVLYEPPIPHQTIVTAGAAHDVLLAAAARTAAPETKGRFWHAVGEKSVAIRRTHRGNDYMLLGVWSTELWEPTDRRDGDGVFASTQEGVRPITASDAAAYRRDGSPKANENPDPDAGVVVPDVPDTPRGHDDGTFYEGDLASLPTDPLRMRTAILGWMRDHRATPSRPDLLLYQVGIDGLMADRSAPLPAQTRAALFQMLASLPGVRSLGTVKDPLGRSVTALTMSDTTGALGTLDWRLYLDARAATVVGTEAVVVKPGRKNRLLRPGVPQYRHLVRTAGWTNTPPAHPLPGATPH